MTDSSLDLYTAKFLAPYKTGVHQFNLLTSGESCIILPHYGVPALCSPFIFEHALVLGHLSLPKAASTYCYLCLCYVAVHNKLL